LANQQQPFNNSRPISLVAENAAFRCYMHDWEKGIINPRMPFVTGVAVRINRFIFFGLRPGYLSAADEDLSSGQIGKISKLVLMVRLVMQ
jgi:hypothetical protein